MLFDMRGGRTLAKWIFEAKTKEIPFMARFAVINLIGFARIGAAWAEVLLLKAYHADRSGIGYLITVLFLAGHFGMVCTVLGLITLGPCG